MVFEYRCRRCEFRCKHEKIFVKHLSDLHSKTDKEEYIEFVLKGVQPVCACGCLEQLPWKGWKHGFPNVHRGHNARIYSSFSDKKVIEKMKISRKESFESGAHTSWNKGLTSETDERLAISARKNSKTLRDGYESGRLVSWQTGLDKSNSNALSKMSETKKRKFKSGDLKSWNKGKTKENCLSLASASMKISESYRKRIAGKRLSPDEVLKRIHAAGFELVDSNYDGYTKRRVRRINVLHNKCNKTQSRSLASIESGHCIYCNSTVSLGQSEIEEFVKSLGFNPEISSRTIIAPREIDIWIPEAKLGIEYNGLYWHSDVIRDAYYHEEKTLAMMRTGNKLFHVFSDEWTDKREIVESMIQSRLGICKNKIGARQCEIRILDKDTRSDFFNKTHLDGDTRATIAFGLYYKNELLSAISLRRPFHKKWSNKLEVARFSTLRGWLVIGALGKLSSHSLNYAKQKELEGLITYVDTRHGTGDSYKKAGFTVFGKTTQRFWWTDFRNRFDRFSIRADKSRGMTEAEVAKEAGVIRIYGCQNIVFLMS